MIEKTLKSGANLKITLAPFGEAKALYQAVLEELKHLNIEAKTELDVNFFKNIFCVGFSSKKIENCLNVCMKRVLYKDLKIDENTFEPVEAREDYFEVCFEVLKENLLPFTKSLSAQYSAILESLKSSLA